MEVKPSEVRLKVSDGDGMYKWKLENKFLRPLFEKHLSKHSVGAYMQLCEELGSGFRAILTEHQEQDSSAEEIPRLQQEVIDLTKKLDLAHEQILRQKQTALDANAEIQEKDLIIRESETAIQNQMTEIEQWTLYSESLHSRCLQGSDYLMQALQLLQGTAFNTMSDS
ncbi:unnamed protein product [Penicillium salamii]|nr:unnamed protein product [Penicillium salamii]